MLEVSRHGETDVEWREEVVGEGCSVSTGLLVSPLGDFGTKTTDGHEQGVFVEFKGGRL